MRSISVLHQRSLTRFFSLRVICSTLIVGLGASHALAGGAGPGGGDLCEARFKTVAADLKAWIVLGGPSHLDLKLASGSLSVAAYSTGMLKQIDRAVITCVSKGDPGYPVVVNGHPKECLNYIDRKGVSRIVCDRIKFYSGLRSPENDPSQYEIAHHEYATLAGFEVPSSDNSQYPISNQITGFLQDQFVKKLVVEPNPANTGIEPGCMPQNGFTCRMHPGLFLRQTFVVQKDITFPRVGTDAQWIYFVEGAQVSANKAMGAQSFCALRANITNGITHLSELPPSLIIDGRAILPKSIDTLSVTELSWHDGDIFLAGTLPDGESATVGLRCGSVQGGLDADDLTSLQAVKEHLAGILDLQD